MQLARAAHRRGFQQHQLRDLDADAGAAAAAEGCSHSGSGAAAAAEGCSHSGSGAVRGEGPAMARRSRSTAPKKVPCERLGGVPGRRLAASSDLPLYQHEDCHAHGQRLGARRRPGTGCPATARNPLPERHRQRGAGGPRAGLAARATGAGEPQISFF